MKNKDIKIKNYGIQIDREPLGKKILNLNNLKHRVIKKEFENKNIDNNNFGLLIHVYRNPGIPQETVRKNLGYDKTTLSKTITRLIKNNLLYKIKNPNDGRSFCIYCTKHTENLMPDISNAVILEQNIFCKDLSEDEVITLYKLLNKVTKSFESYMNPKDL